MGRDGAVLNEAGREHLAKKVAFEQKSEEEREQLVVAVCWDSLTLTWPFILP